MTTPRQPKLRAVYVEWEDSSYAGGWRYDSREGAHTPAIIRSVGIVRNSTKGSITLATSFDGEEGFLQTVTIPRSAIRKTRKVSW